MITFGFMMPSLDRVDHLTAIKTCLTFSVTRLIVSGMTFKPRDVVFILVPRFSMIALYSALEPLRVANRFAGDRFSWRFASLDGAAVIASNGIPVSVTTALAGIGAPEVAVVCSSYEHEAGMSRPLLNELRRLARNGTLLAALDTGAFLLAEAGVLDGYRATCHWETLPAFRESYPRVDVADETYILDRGRMTASGGAAPLDMMIDWLGAIEGEQLASRVADSLVHTRHMNHTGDARVPAGSRYGVRDQRVIAAIELMEEHLEEYRPLSQISSALNISERQLERLFRRELRSPPLAFYRRLRLERAEQLLLYSRMSIREVGLATGFSSLALFSRAFKAQYGRAPSFTRRPAIAGSRQPATAA
jgi:AraC family transcriptional regulator, carnitine catabolism transcriptional activator